MSGSVKVTYRASRLEFRRKEIEPLELCDRFRVETNDGTFEMSKKEFLDTFSNVVRSRSYQSGRYKLQTRT